MKQVSKMEQEFHTSQGHGVGFAGLQAQQALGRQQTTQSGERGDDTLGPQG